MRNAGCRVVTVTLETGLGIAAFDHGVLVPISGYSHLMIDGTEVEALTSGQAWSSPSREHRDRHLETVGAAIAGEP